MNTPSLLFPPSTPTSERGRRLWSLPLHNLPQRSSAWVAWYQKNGWRAQDALHHACEARHHEVEVQPSGRMRRALWADVVPGVTVKPGLSTALFNHPAPTGSPLDERLWDLVRSAWKENLVVWDALPDERAIRARSTVSKQEWRRTLNLYKLAGVRFPAYEDARNVHDRLVQLFDLVTSVWGLPRSAVGLNGRLTIVLGGGTFPDQNGLGGQYDPLGQGGELHLPVDLPWNAFAHEWFHALDHWLGQLDGGPRGTSHQDASDAGAAFGRRSRSALNVPAWESALTLWHSVPNLLRAWTCPNDAQDHWRTALATYPARLAAISFSSASQPSTQARFDHYQQGMAQRWQRALHGGEWSLLGEADHFVAALDHRRVGDQVFRLNEAPDDWEALMEGHVLLKHRQNPGAYGLETLRHATMVTHHKEVERVFFEPNGQGYYAHLSEQRAWSFETSCDPCSMPWDRPHAHAWGVVRSAFPYASGTQAQREGKIWRDVLQALQPLLPGWEPSNKGR